MVHFFSAQEIEHAPHLFATPPGYSASKLDIAALTGHEVATKHFDKAVHYLNRTSHLGMDETDEAMLGMMLGQLQHTTRFGGDERMIRVRGENSATHSCQCVVFAKDVFDQAQQVEKQGRSYHTTPLFSHSGIASSPHAVQLRQIVGLALLLHDCGEMLGEFSTVMQRTTDNEFAKFDKAHLESAIAKLSLSLAVIAAEKGDAKPFHETMDRLRKEARIQIDGVPQKISEKDAEWLTRLIERETPMLSEAQQKRVGQWMELFDLVEFKKLPENPEYEPQLKHIDWDFLSNFIKALDHCQGTRHLVRFAEKDDRLKLSKQQRKLLTNTPSSVAGANLTYAEKELPPLFESIAMREQALVSGPVDREDGRIYRENLRTEEALARSMASRVYDTLHGMLAHVPPLIDAIPQDEKKQKPSAEVKRIADNIALNMGYADKHGKPKRKAFRSDMADLEKRATLDARASLVHVYQQAREQVQSGDFTPTEANLATLYAKDELPASLPQREPLPYTRIDSHHHDGRAGNSVVASPNRAR